jgi:antitoxin component YwqK of YwqJK toxin-antitoxin module
MIKRIMFTAVISIIGFTSGQSLRGHDGGLFPIPPHNDIEPVNGEILINNLGLYYVPGKFEPYSGIATWYYDNGQKMIEVTLKDGKEEGKWTAWHDNGQKFEEGNLKDGKPDGLWTYWGRDGSISWEQIH